MSNKFNAQPIHRGMLLGSFYPADKVSFSYGDIDRLTLAG
jgi:hypothetical protein